MLRQRSGRLDLFYVVCCIVRSCGLAAAVARLAQLMAASVLLSLGNPRAISGRCTCYTPASVATNSKGDPQFLENSLVQGSFFVGGVDRGALVSDSSVLISSMNVCAIHVSFSGR